MLPFWQRNHNINSTMEKEAQLIITQFETFPIMDFLDAVGWCHQKTSSLSSFIKHYIR